MADDLPITIFEITGDEIVGGDSSTENDQFLDRVNQLQEHAARIGNSLGMKEVSLAVTKEAFETVGFRFAESSSDRYDVKGLWAGAQIRPTDVLKRLR